ncbi:MAG: CoA transferase [Pseudolabrys sp.]|nr:CoA transferase [Pseudolabrys sp.]MDP2293897.1 CoA transferase [Pseudolabrys sp.]
MSDKAPLLPLSRFRVLELGSTIAGPFCGRLLADFGAQVIKVEEPAGDTLRGVGRQFHGKSLYAASLFRNKSTISIDLRKAEGQEVIKTLVAKCDVLIENFRPGTLESWGLGYPELSKINPGLILVRISGFGQTGPYSQRPGYGVIGEAVSGLRSINGDPDRPPARMATALTDYITGLYGAFGAMVALLNRQFTGRGQSVDAALSECAFSFMDPYVPIYDKLGEIAQRAGSRLPGANPNNLYATQDQSFIHIAAFSDSIFKRLCTAMGQVTLSLDPKFALAQERNENADELDEIIAQWTASHTLVDAEKILSTAGVPATRIFNIGDIFADPHYRARGMLVPTPDDDLGTITLAAPVPRLSDTPGRIAHAGRRIGQDTRQVLAEVAEFSPEKIDRLVDAKIVFEKKRE